MPASFHRREHPVTGIEELLSRALLVRERTVPRDVIPSPAPTPAAERHAETTGQDAQPNAATEDLHALCETLVLHTPPATVVKFVTDQVPEPRSALVLACVLQLTDTAEGARFWWQYAAGAGQAAAAYCLYLHHLALGERETAEWWHRQVDAVQPTPEAPAWDDGSSWNPAENRITSASTSQFMRILRHLAQQTVRSRPASVCKLMAYIPTVVTAGYLREPDSELPCPEGNSLVGSMLCLPRSTGPTRGADGPPIRSPNPVGPRRLSRWSGPISRRSLSIWVRRGIEGGCVSSRTGRTGSSSEWAALSGRLPRQACRVSSPCHSNVPHWGRGLPEGEHLAGVPPAEGLAEQARIAVVD